MQPSVEIFIPDDLVAGSFPVDTQVETFASGQKVPRGAVLGRVTADGTVKLSDAGASDGSERPVSIAVHAVDATAGEVSAPTYCAGNFRFSRLTLGADHSEGALRAAFDGSPITLVFKDR